MVWANTDCIFAPSTRRRVSPCRGSNCHQGNPTRFWPKATAAIAGDLFLLRGNTSSCLIKNNERLSVQQLLSDYESIYPNTFFISRLFGTHPLWLRSFYLFPHRCGICSSGCRCWFRFFFIVVLPQITLFIHDLKRRNALIVS